MENIPAPVRVLVVDDDVKLLGLLSEYLPRFQIEAVTAKNAKEGLEILERTAIDLVILDVLMPGMDGFETCKEIRRRSGTPILMLSARGDAMDRIVGLELGADDYMSKPFEPRELVTRIRTILRRVKSAETGLGAVIRVGDLEIRTDERAAYLDGAHLALTSMEYELLRMLAVNPGKTMSRDDLAKGLQGGGDAGFSRSIDILVSRLRSKLGDDARSARYIKSVHGFGYAFTGTGEKR